MPWAFSVVNPSDNVVARNQMLVCFKHLTCWVYIYMYTHTTCHAHICIVYTPWIMITGTLTLRMGYKFNSCGILQLKMQGWVGRVTLCIGEFFMPTLCTLYPPSYVISIHTLTHGWESVVKDMPGYAIPSFVFQMRWNNKWCNAMWKSIYDFIGDHPCPPTRRKQSLPELSIVMFFRLHYFKFVGFV